MRAGRRCCDVTLPPARHDALFRLLVSDPDRAGHMLRKCLPADAIFRIRLKGGGRAWGCVLLEHEARADPLTPLQLLRYMVGLQPKETDGGGSAGRLPLIIPVVFYRGREPWSAPLSVQEMIDAPEGLERLGRSFGSHTLRDLGRTAPEKLSLDVRIRSGFLALALSNRESSGDDDMFVAGIAVDDSGRYVSASVVEQVSLPPGRIEAALRQAGRDPYEVEDIVGTAGRICKEQGRQERLAEGDAETFLRQARVKFGGMPHACVERVRAAAAGVLDAWLDALITAEDIEAVFAERLGH